MNVICQNSSCGQILRCDAVAPGTNVACPTCGFISSAGATAATSPEALNGSSASAEFVIYDLETTGLNPDDEDLIQIAAIRFREGRPIDSESFFSYAKPRGRISGFITSYTGVTNHDVRDAPTPCEVLREFSRFAGKSTLIAHNGLRFDSKFLTATCLRSRIVKRTVPCIDSIWLSKAVFGSQRGVGHGLDLVIERLGIKANGVRRHDARGDVELLGLAVAKLWQHLKLSHDAAGVRRHEACLPQT